MSASFSQPHWQQSQLIAQVDSSNRVETEEPDIPTVPIALSIFFVILIVWFLKSFLRICNPNEILILSGRKHRNKDGQTVGYRVIFGGRVVSIPILETVKTMDMTTMPVPVEVKNAYSKGGTPLDIQAIANVKIASDPEVVGNAIERFLDRDRKEILRVARETLEGNLRGGRGLADARTNQRRSAAIRGTDCPRCIQRTR